ncbi:GIY-YIG nuclease family protein [Desulfovibrio sp. TomC]|uniref:GIY-YIG nuclease family protein n=1 Tax=Desulfovibrio sp. TomC TaxID=1562888 RepID=UPI0009E1ADB0|nr:GIY-YIG nuclease family protein [Desulfovibrio sp. TomC]
MKLSQQVNSIINNRPFGWEFLLISQYVMEGINNNRKSLLNSGNHCCDGERLTFYNFSEWIKRKGYDLNILFGDVISTLVYFKSNLPKIIGREGQSGNVDEIFKFTCSVIDLHRKLIQWKSNVENVNSDALFSEIIPKISSVADPIIRELSKFGNELHDSVIFASKSPVGSPQRNIAMKISFDDIDTEPMIREFEKVAIAEVNKVFKDFENFSAKFPWENGICKPALTDNVNDNNKKNFEGTLYSDTSGYIYALVNSSMSGLIKIGKTKKSPKERMKELSRATGVPTPFMLLYDVHVKNCHEAEKFVHNCLKNRRVNSSREFFAIETNEAVEVLTKLRF